ncbi:aldehyde dehydrogenase [Curvibacter sp. HBC28]|uniref:Aldehyde dehydrogenase n=1 Tax=Curvibacter microcysteis TaxID=3026419 RepID=A0ABT5M9C9_9BURK|nr:aldehyde dehydrogenase [Curvibacter sp. HBC28]MDD0813192.1 aldehyde dehydrogenase [Curvibacter sp. HBC28]
MKSQLLIDNDWVNALGDATFERRHPISNALITEAAAASVEDAKKAAESAQAAYKAWRLSPPSERRRLLLKAADILESKTPQFIETMAAEVGASALWAGFNVHLAANVFREAASLATQIQGETIPTDKPGALSMTLRQPVGVIFSMVPWNGTVVLAARAIAYPIVCGNAVVFRGSEVSPKTHALIAEALVEAGFPPGVLNYLSNAPQTAPEVVDTLIAHPAIRRINFTGSTRVGRIVAEKAAQHLKRCLLELGGKSPLIVLDDAHVDEAVKAAVFGSFLYQGQICMSTERLIVDEKVADEFVTKFAARASQLLSGDPSVNPQCVIGPMINPSSGVRINDLLQDALDKGAKLVCGGVANGAVMPATILDHVTASMKIYDQETFGPITVVVRVKTAAEAIAVANDSAYGLSSGVFGRDVNRALAVGLELEYGSVHINGSTVQNEAQAPYGGTKQSGYGRFDGRAVIDEFTELKWLTIEPQEQQYPF